VIALDLPGQGDSTRDPNAKYGFQDQADRLDAILSAVGVTGPFHIGGNSMGGGIAALYAAQHPDRLKSLWLVDTAGVLSAKPSRFRQMVAAGKNPLVVGNVQEFDEMFAFVFVHPPRVPGFLKPEIVRRIAAHRDFNRKVFADLAGATFSIEGAMKGLPVRTLITWGDQDQLTDVSGAETLHALIPRSTLDILPGVGHVPMGEQPQLVAEHYLNFQAAAK
jgi:pimeloyl-ACP methyl ester carboxylesterase